MTSVSVGPKRDLALEGLRGLCALLVVYGHMTYQAPVLDPGYACDLLHVDFGPDAVFVFFVVSGYVIGLTTRGPADGPGIRHYCSRRLLRIVPIAWTAVLLSRLLAPCSPSALVGNLFFLQNTLPYPFGIRIPVLPNDPPLWSLSYEMLYYALFILVWRRRPRVGAAFAAAAAVAFASVLGLPEIFSRFAAYFVFWLCGLCIAWFADSQGPDARSAWPSALLGAFAMWSMEPVRSFCALHPLRILGSDLSPTLGLLDVLLGSLPLVLAVIRRAPVAQARIGLLCAVLGLTVLPFKLAGGSLSYVDLLSSAALCLCVLARDWRPTLGPVRLLAPVGLVSYALYATAFPLMRLVFHSRLLPSGTAGTFALRALVLGLLCAAVAVLLERVLQPRWVRWATVLFRLRPEGIPRTSPLPGAGT